MLRRLYAPFRVEHGSAPVYRFGRRSTGDGREWQAELDGTVVAAHPRFRWALQELEYALCCRVIEQRSGLLVLHGATVYTEAGAAFLTGRSEAGKTTLALALAADGYAVGSDDVAFLDPDSSHLHPLPRCAHIDDRCQRLLRARGLRITDPLARRHRFVTPADLGGHAHGPATVRHIVLLDRGPGAQPRVWPVPQAEAAVFLLREAGWENHPTADALAAIARFTGAAACRRVERGRLDPTVAAVSACIGPPPSRPS
jgi:hypothetical protein